jgi:uncharacterized protein
MGISREEIYGCLANNVLRLILMPTEACNFRCLYCYEEFKYARMDPHVVQGVERYLSRRAPELDVLSLSWFGGEPLLALDIVEDLLEHAAGLRHGNPRLRFFSDITTNGYLLTPARFGKLLELGVGLYQVSFDGPRAWHDRTRVLAGGRGTFDRLWANLLAMRQAEGEFKVVVRLHVHRGNSGSLPEFMDAYAEHFGRERRFKLFLHRVAPLGGPHDDDFPFLPDAGPGDGMETLKSCAEERRIDYVTSEEPMVCYAARGNSFVVRADGRVNKCTVALEHPANQVGRIHADGRLELASDTMRAWMRGVWSGKDEELECPMHGLADPGPRPVALRVSRRTARPA